MAGHGNASPDPYHKVYDKIDLKEAECHLLLAGQERAEAGRCAAKAALIEPQPRTQFASVHPRSFRPIDQQCFLEPPFSRPIISISIPFLNR